MENMKNMIKNLKSREEIRVIIKKNLNKLMAAKGYTQAMLGEIFDVNARSTISNYLNDDHDSMPDVAALYRLKEFFGIPLDMLFSPNFEPSTNFAVDGTDLTEYKKFVGVYSLYYLTTSKISAIPNKYNQDTQLNYGVLAIVKNSASNGLKDSYKAYACFSMKEESAAMELKAEVEKAITKNDHFAVGNLFTKRDRYCEGEFELIQKGKHYSVDMTGYSVKDGRKCPNDKILLMGFNPDNTDTQPYIGGAALSSSLSRGESKSPCSQIIMVSRNALTEESVAIKELLFELRKTTDQSASTESIMDRIRKLNENEDYAEEDKEILLRFYIEKKFKEESEKTSSQLLYLFSEQDKIVYHFLKKFI